VQVFLEVGEPPRGFCKVTGDRLDRFLAPEQPQEQIPTKLDEGSIGR